jgi:hypothetical protein
MRHNPFSGAFRRFGVPSVLLLMAAACSDSSELAEITAPARATEAISSDDVVARALAMALANEPERRALHAALRDSPWMDHKLILQEYLSTAPGTALAARAAAASGLTESAFREHVRTLPRMDLYLPFRDHRLAWRASDELLVVATRNLDPDEVAAFASSGARVTLRQADGVPTRSVLVLHPAEPRIALVKEALRTSGEAIELPEDDAKGTETHYAFIEPCDPIAITCEQPEPPPSYPPAPPKPGDYITYFLVSENDGFLGGTMEMEFRNIYGGPFPPVCAYYAVAYNGVHENRAYNVNLWFGTAGFCFGEHRAIQVWEMDGGSFSLNQNDPFGQRINEARFQPPQEIYYNFPMRFPVTGPHHAELTIVQRN